MDVGIMFANTGGFAGAEGAAELGKLAEAHGFESVWTVEHVIFPTQYESAYPYSSSGKMAGDPSSPLPDPLLWLTYLGAHTTRLRLGTGILILPQRNPLILAKEAATLDALTGGRLELGVGVGWLEEEFDALGVPFAGRGERADEYVEVLRSLWDADDVSHAGRHVAFDGVSVNPKPAQGRVPITVGGHSAAAARRAGRLGDGFFPGRGDPGELAELFAVVRAAAEEAGRDPAGITLTAGSRGLLGDDPVGAAEELASLGVSRVVVPSFALYRPSPQEAAAELGERVVAPLRDVTPG